MYNEGDSFLEKIKTVEELKDAIGAHEGRQKTVIMCHGTFDVVHPGHIRHLLYAKSKADILIASLTCDIHVTKADMRPFVPQDLRAMNLAAMEMVDYVLIDPAPTPLNNLAILQPDFFAKGYEYTDGAINPKTQEEIDVLETYGGEMIFTPGDIVYSSSALLNLAPPNIGVDKLGTLLKNEAITFDHLRHELDAIKGKKVHVVGDTIVDTYTRGTIIGGMTKTPTMSMRFESQEKYTGGAGIVAKHLAAAGADVTFTTVLGKDALKDMVVKDLEEAGVTINATVDKTRPTTEKNAFIAGDYRLLKVDTLDNSVISGKILKKIIKQIKDVDCDVLIFSDFRHGIFTKETITEFCKVMPERAYKVADSQVASRWGNILDFKGFDLITPNEREMRFSLADQDTGVKPLGSELYKQAECKTLILKLGDRGIITYRDFPADDPRAILVVDSVTDQVKDAVGAGDALLSYACLAMAASGNEAIASIIGSCAAAIECEMDGNIPVSPDLVLDKINQLEKRFNFEG